MTAPLLKLLSSAAVETPDAELLGRFVAGRDEAAFAEIVRRHGPAVYRTCQQILGRSSADDAFQAAFLVLACRAKSIRKTASVGSWLIGVAGRVSRQMHRSRMRKQRTEVESFDSEHPVESASDATLLASELAAVLAEELARLPESLRDPVALCLIDGRTHEEAAAELGGSARTVRRRLNQARTLLRLRLERRGIVPAVAAGMVASIGPATAVPPDLVRRTVDAVFSFLTGSGAITPAAVIAKGVVGSMVKIKISAAMGVMAATLIGLGVVWADEKAPAGIATANLPVVENEPTPAAPAEPFRGAGQELRVNGTRVGLHRTANFIVTAPKPWMARAIANEAEYQRRELAKPWLGQALPDWEKPCPIEFSPGAAPGNGSTTMMFMNTGQVPVASLEMELRGSFESVLDDTLPHEVMHTVLASNFGKPLPRWADEGIAMLAESKESQARHDEKIREILKAGRGLRLKALFSMTEYPKDVLTLHAQGHSIVRFLTSSGMGLRAGAAGASGGNHQLPHCQYLLEFIRKGMKGNNSGSWGFAAQEIYSFSSLEEMEEAWLEWLKLPESRVIMAAEPVKGAEPERIPPVALPGPRTQEPPRRPRLPSLPSQP